MPDPEMVALTALPRELSALTGASTVPTYRQLWNMVVDGRLPSVRQVGRAYQISRADLPALAEQLGLVPKTQKPQRTSRKAGASQAVAA